MKLQLINLSIWSFLVGRFSTLIQCHSDALRQREVLPFDWMMLGFAVLLVIRSGYIIAKDFREEREISRRSVALLSELSGIGGGEK